MNSARRSEPTTIGAWIFGIARALDAVGLDGAAIAREAGIDVSQLAEPGARSPLSANTHFWRLAVQATGDPCFGLRVPAFVPISGLHAVTFAAISSPNVRTALERIVRYQRVISGAAVLELEELPDRFRFRIATEPWKGMFADEAVDAFLAYTIRSVRILVGDRRLTPLDVEVQRPEPTPSAAFGKTFGCPVRFGAARNAIELARSDVERTLPTANAELARINDEVAMRYLARVDFEVVSARVRGAVLESLPEGLPSQDAVARKLAMSRRNLQRRLAGEGTSYKTIVDDLRAALARDYVKAGQMSVAEIAYLLGFSEVSAFSHAFKRWTGVAPTLFGGQPGSSSSG